MSNFLNRDHEKISRKPHLSVSILYSTSQKMNENAVAEEFHGIKYKLKQSYLMQEYMHLILLVDKVSFKI